MIKATVNRVAGYALSVTVSLVFYVSWIAAEVGPGGLRRSTTLAAGDNSYLPTRRCHFGVSWIIAGEMKAADVSA
jgi:hypothetical protein